MEALNKLHETLSAIRKSSEEILERSLSVLTEIREDENDLVESIIDETSTSDESLIVDWITSYIEEATKDAKKVLVELDDFAEAVVNGEEMIEELDSDFFKNVWFGDMYDRSGVEGLESLLQDLKRQKGALEENTLIKNISSNISILE